MINDLPLDILLNSISFLEIKYIVIFSSLNRKFRNIIKIKFDFLLKNCIQNNNIKFIQHEDHITIKSTTRALSFPISILKIELCEKINLFLKII